MEAKNAYTKKAARCGNFKNVCLSFAVRHQRLLAFHLSNPQFLTIDINSGPGKCTIHITLNDDIQYKYISYNYGCYRLNF